MSDPQKGPVIPSGQASAPVQAPATGESPFLEYEWEQGKKDTFKTKEEALKYFREGTLRHQDYTKKTQELAKQREAQTKREKEIEEMARAIAEKQSRIDPLDKFLTERKDVADYIATQMRTPSQENVLDQVKRLVEESTKPLQEKLTEAENWRKEQEAAANRERVLAHLATQYPDFNRDEIESLLEEMDQTPEGDEERAYLETLYWAQKGKKATATPVEIEQKVSASLRDKAGRFSPVPSSNAAPPKTEATPKSIRDAVDQYKAKHPG